MANENVVMNNGDLTAIGRITAAKLKAPSAADFEIGSTTLAAKLTPSGIGAVPVTTSIEDVPERFTMNDLKDKVNQLIHVVAQRSSMLVVSLLFCYTSSAEVYTAPLGTLYNDSLVVTNVTGGGSSMTTNIVSDISDNRITNSVLAGYLCTVSAAQAMTNDATIVRGENIDGRWNISITGSASSAESLSSQLGWGQIAGTPSSISGYGITDAKIENGTITLGANTLSSLKNPYALTFAGTASGSYDGSAALTVTIPEGMSAATATNIATAVVEPTSNVVFNTETYFALNDGDLELVSESNLVFQGVYELTNYTDAANVTIYHGQIASQTLTNQSLLNITLKFPTGAQKAGDAMLRVVSTLAATATVVCVEGATTAHLAGVKDWGIFDAGSTNLLSFTKVAMENGDWEIWVGKAKSEL